MERYSILHTPAPVSRGKMSTSKWCVPAEFNWWKNTPQPRHVYSRWLRACTQRPAWRSRRHSRPHSLPVLNALRSATLCKLTGSNIAASARDTALLPCLDNASGSTPRKSALSLRGGKKVAVQIPASAELVAIESIPEPVVDRQQEVQVKWEGKTITMFAVDLREYAEPILTETRRSTPADL